MKDELRNVSHHSSFIIHHSSLIWMDKDPTAKERKKDHIELAFQSQVGMHQLDQRFYYEPLLSAHPTDRTLAPFSFLGKEMKVPIWVSSMTGGTALAKTINHNLARACGEFGMGMGLGSCRSLLYSDEMFPDFDVRHLIGHHLPLYANLGVAQVEQLIAQEELYRVEKMVAQLKADGLIIHVNPFQEWMQPEGDHFSKAPIDTIRAFLDKVSIPVIVKEVGQGMGYESLKALFQLPLMAVDFAASGGTNFALLELLRSDPIQKERFQSLPHIGHSAKEMVQFTNALQIELGDQMKCQQVIISGGIKDFLDGYYLMRSLQIPSIYGQASGFLKHARGPYETLRQYVADQIEGLKLANAYLRVRT